MIQWKKKENFELDIDSKTPNAKPFANIRTKTFIPDEDEVLIMMGSVFRIDEVRQNNDLWHIHLTLCGCKELDQEKLAERWKECLEKNSSLHALYLRNSKNWSCRSLGIDAFHALN
jgi:hypothetical protein